jgi:hypothetical protein
VNRTATGAPATNNPRLAGLAAISQPRRSVASMPATIAAGRKKRKGAAHLEMEEPLAQWR